MATPRCTSKADGLNGARTTAFHACAEHRESAEDVLRRLESRIGPLSTDAPVPQAPPRVLIISGPSGVGKDAVLAVLQKRNPQLHFIVTATTRAPRDGEVDGVDYHFVSRETFETWIKEGKLVEHAIVYGEYKGIPRPQVEKALAEGRDVVLRIDVQGAATVAESDRSLALRLVARKTEGDDQLAERIRTARAELSRASEFDYVVVNRSGAMEATVDQIQAILEAERSKVQR